MFEPAIDISDKNLRNQITASLPAFKNQLDGSNNQMLLNTIADLFICSKNNLLNLIDVMDLNNARGKNLTDIGLDYGVERFDDDDDFLRFEIRWQILKSNTKLDINSIKTLISILLNIPVTDFDIVKTGRPHEVELIDIPLDIISGDHVEQKREILSDDLQSVLPAETLLKDIQYIQQVDMYKAIAPVVSIENEYNVDSGTTDISYEVYNNLYVGASVQIEHEYNV